MLSYRSQGKCHYLGCSGLKLRVSPNCSFCLSPHIWLDLTMLNSHHLSSLESVFPFHTDGHHQSTGSYYFLPQLLKLYLDLLAIKIHPTRQVSHHFSVTSQSILVEIYKGSLMGGRGFTKWAPGETVNPLKFSKTLLKQDRNLIENANVSQRGMSI